MIIDLRKAFDTFNYEVLLNKLWVLGLMDGEHEWFRNYLPNRTLIVEFQSVSGAAKVVSVGVPQEPILGPLFFTFNLRDNANVVVECSVRMNVTDTGVFFHLLKCLLSRLP